MTDRSSIDVALARRLVDSQFPQWADLPISEVEVDGWDNRTFRLGSELTVHLPTGDWYAKQVDKEQRWLPLLAPQLPLQGPVGDRFRAELDVDAATWSRGRGWALWKALITLVGRLEDDSPAAAAPRRDIERVLADHARRS